jgi:hypothetical protein
MNSSMKQPKPSGVSLNDCLLKGPPALADLYTVTLGIREHKVAFTKDISKFYQCVEADEIQHGEPDLPATAKACPAPMGIRFSDVVEEMVDIGAALKRGRGRPKKSKYAIPLVQKRMDPPDHTRGV